ARSCAIPARQLRSCSLHHQHELGRHGAPSGHGRGSQQPALGCRLHGDGRQQRPVRDSIEPARTAGFHQSGGAGLWPHVDRSSPSDYGQPDPGGPVGRPPATTANAAADAPDDARSAARGRNGSSLRPSLQDDPNSGSRAGPGTPHQLCQRRRRARSAAGGGSGCADRPAAFGRSAEPERHGHAADAAADGAGSGNGTGSQRRARL
ncbi:MAG: hypothetical protein AVDCRST_MAG62-1063, partial [uncultured Sphingomonas sp.]